MKKLKLFFAACALLLGGSSVSAQQTDVTATYLTNADFSAGTPIDNGVCTYGKDMAGNNTTYYGAQPIDGWTNASVGEEDSGYDNCKLAGAIFAYGGTPWLGGTDFVAPETDPKGNAGNAAGLCAVWGGSIQYTQDVTLPAGSYTIRFKVYNSTNASNNSGKFITTNLFGFIPNEGDAYCAPNKTFAIGQWSTVAVTFNLTEETAGKISMGYVGPSGAANMPHLFVDNVKILQNTYYEDVTSKVGVTQADWGGTETNAHTVTTSDGRTINMIADYGQSSGIPMEQTITGLSKGTYEVVVYCYSQMEWKSGGDWLTHDAGDVGYVAAEGTHTITEWINARRGPGYPADGPGIYCLSGVEVGDAGTLTLSYNLAKKDRTEWHGLQIQSLIYTKNLDLSGLVSAYETALGNAKAVDKSKKMRASILTALQDAINAYDEGKVDKEDAEALETATSALETATTNANTSIASYAIIAAGSIPDNSVDGWVCENPQGIHVNTWSSEGNSDGSNMKTPFIENWVGKGSYLGAGKVYYQLSGLEPGEVYYAQALVRSYNEKNSDAPNGPNFFINDEVVDMTKAGTTFTYNGMSGIYATLGGAATVGEDGILKLGVEIAEDRNYNWVAFKSVSIRPMSDAYDAAVAKVTALDGTIPAAAYNVAYGVVEKWNADYPTTAAKFEEAIGEIEAAAETASACVAPYATAKSQITTAGELTANYAKLNAAVVAYSSGLEALSTLEEITSFNTLLTTANNTFSEWLKMKGYADALVAVPNDKSEANTALANAIATLEANVQKVAEISEESLATISTSTTDLKSAMTTYVFVATPVGDGAKFDCTFMLTNPDLTPFYTGGHGVHPAGWATEQADGNYQVIPSEGAANPDGIHKYCYEYWSENPKDNSKFNLYTPVTLPEGTYTMSCYAFADQPTNGDNCAVYFYANDTQGGLVSDAKLTQKSISFVNDTEQEVKIGLKPLTGNTYRWMGIGYVELYKVPAQVYEISENANYDNTQEGAGDVTLNRTIKVGYNTLVLPFSVSQAEVEEAFGEGSVVYDLSSIEGDVWHFVTKVDGISANRPCILKATKAGTSYNFEDRSVVAGAPVLNLAEGGMTGSYAASLTVPEGNYIINGDKLYRVNSAVTIKGTRAYFNTTKNSEARTATLSFDGEILTGISAVEGGELKKAFTGEIFDLTGRKVKNPSNGVYVVEGKKVVF